MCLNSLDCISWNSKMKLPPFGPDHSPDEVGLLFSMHSSHSPSARDELRGLKLPRKLDLSRPIRWPSGAETVHLCRDYSLGNGRRHSYPYRARILANLMPFTMLQTWAPHNCHSSPSPLKSSDIPSQVAFQSQPHPLTVPHSLESSTTTLSHNLEAIIVNSSTPQLVHYPRPHPIWSFTAMQAHWISFLCHPIVFFLRFLVVPLAVSWGIQGIWNPGI